MIRKTFVILLLLAFFGVNSHAQERLYFQCDRYVHLAGDTLWWKASIINDVHNTSAYTNLHTELRTYQGHLIGSELFPVYNKQCVGQIFIPDTLPPGIYWLRIYAGENNIGSANISATVPITLYQEGSQNMTLMVNSSKSRAVISSLISLHADTLNAEIGGYNVWRLDINDTTVYHFSCSVTDASLPIVEPISSSETNGFPNSLVDTSYLSWTGKALKSGSIQSIKGDALMTMLIKDNVLKFSKQLPLKKDGSFQLSHLFFFGKAELYYQINKAGAISKDVTVVLDSIPPPLFKMPTGWIRQDNLLKEATESPTLNGSVQVTSKIKGRELKEVIIKGWHNPRKALDSVYTTGPFSEPALYAFDLRNEKSTMSLEQYLLDRRPPIHIPQTILYYVNEQLKLWDDISDMSLSDIAYIKMLESDDIGNDPFTKAVTRRSDVTPLIIMIYTRKGKDIKKLAGLNKLTLMGYTPIARFTPGVNGATLLWAPLVDVNHIRLRFYNDYPAKSFRLTVRGVSDNGKEIYYTTVLPETNN